MLNFGNGVSRTLTPEQRNFLEIIFQRGKPPLDADINFAQQICNEQLSQSIKSLMPSGFMISPTRSRNDFDTRKEFSNMFRLGRLGNEDYPVMWAHVNGWIIPIAGTNSSDGLSNNIKLSPPPGSDSRIDFVFLEVWQSVISPNPSTVNKPSPSSIWRYGNTEFGGANINDDLIDGTIGREVTKRIQLQYRIRVFGGGSGLGSSLALSAYPDGLDDPNVVGQGNASSPVGVFKFENMADEMLDAGLWRSGNGDPQNELNTVDGYTYAIPICAIFRRNSSLFSAMSLPGSSNNNGGVNRNPSASLFSNQRDGAKEFNSATINDFLHYNTIGNISVTGLNDSGFDDPLYVSQLNKFIVVDDEIIRIGNVDVGLGTIQILERGRGGTNPTGHVAESQIKIFNNRPDGLFSDEIHINDILDLRHAVNPGEWDYSKLLQHNFSSLLRNDLKSSWKKSGTGDTQGVLVTEVDLLHADGTVAPPPDVEVLDGPDGIRTIWSDASVIQPNVTVLCDQNAPLDGWFTTGTFDSTVNWDIGAGFKPNGWVNGGAGGWRNGSCVFLHIGGDSGSQGARATFRSSGVNGVRFLTPKEYWKERVFDISARIIEGADATEYGNGKQYLHNFNIGNQCPVKLNFLGYSYMNSPLCWTDDPISRPDGNSPGYFYPVSHLNFEKPFIFLGGLLNPVLRFSGQADVIMPDPVANPNAIMINTGIDFDVSGDFFNDTSEKYMSNSNQNMYKNNEFDNDTKYKILGGRTNLRKLITAGGTDFSGRSSEAYLVVYGNQTFEQNNGVYRIIGAGSEGNYSEVIADLPTQVVVIPVGPASPIGPGSDEITCEFRSQYTTPEDGNGYNSGIASSVIVLTDINGRWQDDPTDDFKTTPWYPEEEYGRQFPRPIYPLNFPIQISLSLVYDKDRSGFARVPNDVHRISIFNGDGLNLRQSVGSIDPIFPSQSGVPSSEIIYNGYHIGVKSEIQNNGLNTAGEVSHHPYDGEMLESQKINYGQIRDSEAFLDQGSKTINFNPFRKNLMTLVSWSKQSDLSSPIFNWFDDSIIGNETFDVGCIAFGVPYEFMPNFGRQDIPYRNGSDLNFLDGINHLFCDEGDATNPVFYVIGGSNNTTGGNQVNSMFFQTGSVSGHTYGQLGVIVGPGTPAYQARLTTDVGMSTDEEKELNKKFVEIGDDDVGFGIQGIQLPPYFGIARLYGVYERSDFISKGGLTFQSDRSTPVVDPPTNLLKKDSHKQTLYIMENGARDVTLREGDHTYIIPKGIIDITKIAGYNPELSKFSDYNYVVECVVFGFPWHWISRSNYVLCRRYAGNGVEVQNGDQVTLSGISMVIKSPPVLNSRVYSVYDRVPYQGDPYMTRNGDTITTSDYENRYGGYSNFQSIHLGNEIQQYDINGNRIVETPNLRSFEVLASMDFYTTIGTGVIGGKLRPGTFYDVCHPVNDELTSSRIPNTVTDPKILMESRTFTEGQKKNKSRASITLNVERTFEDYLSWTISVNYYNATGGHRGFGQWSTSGVHYNDDPLTGISMPPNIGRWTEDLATTYDAINNVYNLSVPDSVVDNYFPTRSHIRDYTVIAVEANSSGNRRPFLVKYENPTAALVPGEVKLITTGARQRLVFHGDDTVVSAKLYLYAKNSSVEDTISVIYNEFNNFDSSTGRKILYAERGNGRIKFTSRIPGSRGNNIDFVLTKRVTSDKSMYFSSEVNDEFSQTSVREQITSTMVSMSGGIDIVNNAGSGNTNPELVGITERLPLGILLQDSDFLGEDILNDGTSTLCVYPARISANQEVLPFKYGDSYSQSIGYVGQTLAMSDGSILMYEPYTQSSPTGTKKFRLYRGGGSVFLSSGKNPGGPIDISVDNIPKTDYPVLKGAVLYGKVLLVKNYNETAFVSDSTVSHGDELQMIIMTHGKIGNGKEQENGLMMSGLISSMGHGEGYAASDRYRLEARPLLKSRSRTVIDPSTIRLASYKKQGKDVFKYSYSKKPILPP